MNNSTPLPMIPLFEQDGFIICFASQPEDAIAMRHHFIQECGWTARQYRALRGFAWFSARVSAWRNGVEIAATNLGCCCYRTVEEFYIRYRDDYFADMVREVVDEARSTLKAA